MYYLVFHLTCVGTKNWYIYYDFVSPASPGKFLPTSSMDRLRVLIGLLWHTRNMYLFIMDICYLSIICFANWVQQESELFNLFLSNKVSNSKSEFQTRFETRSRYSHTLVLRLQMTETQLLTMV